MYIRSSTCCRDQGSFITTPLLSINKFQSTINQSQKYECNRNTIFLVEGAYYAVTQFGFALQFLFLPKGKFKFFSKYQIEFLANVFKSYQGLEFTNLNNALPPQKCDKFLIQSTFFTEKNHTHCTLNSCNQCKYVGTYQYRNYMKILGKFPSNSRHAPRGIGLPALICQNKAAKQAYF